MSGWPIAFAVLAPLLGIAAFGVVRSAHALRWLLPLASVPALLAALLPSDGLVLPGVLLGSRLEVDGLGRAVLLLVGLAWSAAGWWAADRLRARFRVFAIFWLAALAGMVIAAVAADLATFYTGYVVMTLAGYGLVVHERSPEAWRAGRVYLVLALLGEALLLSGLLFIGARVGNAELASLPAALSGGDAVLAGALLLGGFAVKMGVAPLHVWLPVAHPVAPVPASAILSGVLVKAGLLGALRTVPAQPFDLTGLPATLAIGLGLFTSLYGVAMGLPQQRLKTVLAYSTVSQMGLLFAAVAATLGVQGERGAALITLLVLHHGLNKSALFLAAGSKPAASRLRLVLLALPALAIAGLPFTTGELAKSALKEALVGSAFGAWAVPLLATSSFATALLMLRVFSLARSPQDGKDAVPPVHPAWCLLVIAASVMPWLQAGLDGIARVPDASHAWDATWPAVLALAAAWVWRRFGAAAWMPAIPEGDLLAPATATVAALRRAWQRVVQWGTAADAMAAAAALRLKASRARFASIVQQMESSLVTLPVAGVLLLSLTGLLWWAML
ncbi:complex I subunit 5 family protein [Piscinibacter sp.]|uniref:complex I subunit 5 family protein n=1 Tax=Piscinibacter sp. TaxID=1903157 RepID=UPI002BC162AC|nr:complex I subunit 5 family protein [Albitalea sp.]HUG25650.1 complex I subunit 5 family protein [Albitalea sp.]